MQVSPSPMLLVGLFVNKEWEMERLALERDGNPAVMSEPQRMRERNGKGMGLWF
jgi:hypothetical protein